MSFNISFSSPRDIPVPKPSKESDQPRFGAIYLLSANKAGESSEQLLQDAWRASNAHDQAVVIGDEGRHWARLAFDKPYPGRDGKAHGVIITNGGQGYNQDLSVMAHTVFDGTIPAEFDDDKVFEYLQQQEIINNDLYYLA